MPPLTPYIALAKRFFTFGGGSLIGAVIDYAATLLAIRFLGLSPQVALALAMTVSASVVFCYHETITFPGRKTTRLLPRYVRFMLLAALVLALRVAALHVLTIAGLPVPIALAIVIVVVSLFNFAASSMFVFLKGNE
ncbi:GtrA family protein [Shinella daejeonensis]|uniref:GtrA family protein n=1 Tax=Shinella daejeonensis TaxID=659017 RepID=UPI0020C7652E|nr:GtrA family protein [Shinella daejeonensis]MCP8894150.1 GtrA family protein [Shinella daejeonensis]